MSTTLPPAATSSALGRRFVERTFGEWGVSSCVDDVLLLVTELVTNAVVHAGTEVELTLEARPDAVFASVGDRYSARSLPTEARVPRDDSESGRGIFLVHAISTRWGVEHTGFGKHVWFEVPLLEPVSSTLEPMPARLGFPSANVLVATVWADSDGVITGWRGDAEELLGRPAADAVGHRLGDIVTLEGGHTSLVERSSAVGYWHGPVNVLRPDGALFKAYGVHHATADTSGKPGIVCVWTSADDRALLQPIVVSTPARPAPAPTQATGLAAPLGVPDAVASRLGLADLLAKVLERACSELGGDAGYAILADELGGYELRAAHGLDLDPDMRMPTRSTEGITGRLTAHHMPVVLDDVTDRDSEPVLSANGLRSAVAAPLLVGGRMTGSLHIAARKPNAFTSDDAVELARTSDRVALAVESARLTELEQLRRRWLAYVAEASDLLAGTLDLGRTLALVAQLVVPTVGDWCALHLLDDSGDTQLAYVWHMNETHLDSLRLLLHLANAPRMPDRIDQPAHTRRQPWRPGPLRDSVADQPEVDLPPLTGSIADDDRVVYPLIARNKVIGSLTVGRTGFRFAPGEIDMAVDLARRSALAIDNSRLFAERVAVARALQRSLLPPEAPVVPGCEIGVAYLAAGEGNDVGGDFYDVFAIGDGSWGIAIGDVCGKGAEAAAVTGLARQTIRILGREGRPVTEVLERLNRSVLDEGPRSRFVTVIFGRLEPKGDNAQLTLCVAGHPLPVLAKADGTIAVIGEPQTLLGVMDDVSLRAETVELTAGDTLVLYTDGVTERRSRGQMLGEDGLMDLLRDAATLSAPAIASRIEKAVIDFQPEAPRDDMAVLVIRVL